MITNDDVSVDNKGIMNRIELFVERERKKEGKEERL
jgi:hypothetical protein